MNYSCKITITETQEGYKLTISGVDLGTFWTWYDLRSEMDNYLKGYFGI
jgi:hypothetical protein